MGNVIELSSRRPPPAAGSVRVARARIALFLRDHAAPDALITLSVARRKIQQTRPRPVIGSAHGPDRVSVPRIVVSCDHLLTIRDYDHATDEIMIHAAAEFTAQAGADPELEQVLFRIDVPRQDNPQLSFFDDDVPPHHNARCRLVFHLTREDDEEDESAPCLRG